LPFSPNSMITTMNASDHKSDNEIILPIDSGVNSTLILFENGQIVYPSIYSALSIVRQHVLEFRDQLLDEIDRDCFPDCSA